MKKYRIIFTLAILGAMMGFLGVSIKYLGNADAGDFWIVFGGIVVISGCVVGFADAVYKLFKK